MSVPRNRALIPAAFADLSQWPAPDEDVLNEEILRIYRPRKLAVAMYADGVVSSGCKLIQAAIEN